MQRHVVVDRGPEGLGRSGFKLGTGEAFNGTFPQDARLLLRESQPGRELTDVLSNTEWCFLVNRRTCEVVRSVCGDDGVEYLPFTLHEPDGTLLSADYVIVHPVRFCDVVDRAASELEFEDDDPRGEVTSVESYVFDRARCTALPPLFRVPEWTYDIFLGEPLARALHGAKISNLFLHEVEVR